MNIDRIKQDSCTSFTTMIQSSKFVHCSVDVYGQLLLHSDKRKRSSLKTEEEREIIEAVGAGGSYRHTLFIVYSLLFVLLGAENIQACDVWSYGFYFCRMTIILYAVSVFVYTMREETNP